VEADVAHGKEDLLGRHWRNLSDDRWGCRVFMAVPKHQVTPYMDLRSLVVRLESPFADFAATDATAREIIMAGLAWPTEYWPGLAIGWLEQGAPLDEGIVEALDLVASKRAFAQNVRHRAFALARRWQRRGGAV
jgi:hypothetical protein